MDWQRVEASHRGAGTEHGPRAPTHPSWPRRPAKPLTLRVRLEEGLQHLVPTPRGLGSMTGILQAPGLWA